MWQYDDPVEVRRGEAENPDQFLWRGRLWKVRAVLAHWVETGPWWQGRPDDLVGGASGPTGGAAGGSSRGSVAGLVAGSAAGSSADLVAERELWRVEAGRGIRPGVRTDLRVARDGHDDPHEQETYGVFDLSLDWTDGRWQLVGCLD